MFGRWLNLCAALLALTATHAVANPVKWTTNGHYYDVIMPSSYLDSYTWSAAKTEAEARGGYLVTVTNQGENDFLRANFANQLNYIVENGQFVSEKSAWIGLHAATPTSTFQWVTGEPYSYSNWASTEPNFYGADLWQCVHYWTREQDGDPPWTWNNDKNEGYAIIEDHNTFGYFVEYNKRPPLQWEGNGHYYDLILPTSESGNFTWADAKTTAESMTYLGMKGHLATVTSAGENAFLTDKYAADLLPVSAVQSGDKAWIGLTDSELFGGTEAGSNPTQGWVWTTDELVNYTNWNPNEPNNRGIEDFVHYEVPDYNADGIGDGFSWNDITNSAGPRFVGFFVEYETVPEPGTLALLVLGGLSVIAYRVRGIYGKVCGKDEGQ